VNRYHVPLFPEFFDVAYRPIQKDLPVWDRPFFLAIRTTKSCGLKVAHRNVNVFNRAHAIHFKASLNICKLIPEDCAF